MGQREATRELEKTRFLAARVRPYFAPELWALHPVYREDFPSMSCDQWLRLYFGEEIFSLWTSKEQVGVLIAMLYRVNLNHYGRAKRIRAVPEIWQLASALDVHSLLRSDGLPLPGNPVLPQHFGLPENKPVEWYYNILFDNMGDKMPGTDKTVPQQGDGMPDIPSPDDGFAGGCADGESYDFEAGPPPDPNAQVQMLTADGQMAPPGRSEDDVEGLRVQVAEKVKGRGDVPAGLSRWAEDLLEPKADWRQELAALVRGSISSVRGNDNMTYHRESKRNPGLGFILPSNIGQKVNISVVVDTSGSMCDKELSQAVAEIDAILRDLPWCDNLVVLACDAATHTAKTIRRADQIILKGGGGTDMRVGINDALALYPKPDVIIVITDGYTPWPEQEPDARIVAALTQKPTNHSLPLYAKMVMVEPDIERTSR